MQDSIKTNAPPYREGTQIAPTKVALVLNCGGIGDYIHWIGAIKYVIDTNPHIYGYIVSPTYFLELAELWLGKFSPRFSVILNDVAQIETHPMLQDCAIIAPDRRQYANACGFHLTHLGFIYYTQKNEMIEGYTRIPEIKGNEFPIDRFNLPSRYVVIPTEATAGNRMLPAEMINSITSHLLSRGITPIFLGKSIMAEDHKTSSADGIRLKGVFDLRNKTTLTEAACIMARSIFTLGMDGGLLHLASCSSVPVVFIFTSVHPEYRLPKRGPGTKTITVTPSKELHCRFCNTGEPGKPFMSYVIGHDFGHCLYGDNLCTRAIDKKTLIPIMDKLISEERSK